MMSSRLLSDGCCITNRYPDSWCDLAVGAATRGEELPARYFGTLGAWVALGVPALLAFLAIFWLMIAKPAM